MKLKNYITGLGIGLATLIPYKAKAEAPKLAPIFNEINALTVSMHEDSLGLTMDLDFMTNIALSQRPIPEKQTFRTLEEAVAYLPPYPFDENQVTITAYTGEYGNDSLSNILLSNKVLSGAVKVNPLNPLNDKLDLSDPIEGAKFRNYQFGVTNKGGIERVNLEDSSVNIQSNGFVRDSYFQHTPNPYIDYAIIVKGNDDNVQVERNIVRDYKGGIRINPSLSPNPTKIKDNIFYNSSFYGVVCPVPQFFKLDSGNSFVGNMFNVWMATPPQTIPAETQFWTDKDKRVCQNEGEIYPTIYIQSLGGSPSPISSGASPQDIDVSNYLTSPSHPTLTKAKGWEQYK